MQLMLHFVVLGTLGVLTSRQDLRFPYLLISILTILGLYLLPALHWQFLVADAALYSSLWLNAHQERSYKLEGLLKLALFQILGTLMVLLVLTSPLPDTIRNALFILAFGLKVGVFPWHRVWADFVQAEGSRNTAWHLVFFRFVVLIIFARTSHFLDLSGIESLIPLLGISAVASIAMLTIQSNVSRAFSYWISYTNTILLACFLLDGFIVVGYSIALLTSGLGLTVAFHSPQNSSNTLDSLVKSPYSIGKGIILAFLFFSTLPLWVRVSLGDLQSQPVFWGCQVLAGLILLYHTQKVDLVWQRLTRAR